MDYGMHLGESFYPRGSEETGRPMLVAYGIKHPAMKEGIGWGAIDKDGTCRFGDGRVFVMNENGRTVGNYDLEELSVPKSMISGSRTSSSRDPGNDLNTFQ